MTKFHDDNDEQNEVKHFSSALSEHIATINEYGLSGLESVIDIVNEIDFSIVYEDMPIELVPFGYLALAELLLMCQASIIYIPELNVYDVIYSGDVNDFVEAFDSLLTNSMEEDNDGNN